MDHLQQDVRYALRAMRHAPVFTAAALVMLALGIGANTAIFALVNALMLRALPVRDPAQLVALASRYPGEPPNYGFAWKFTRVSAIGITCLAPSPARRRRAFR